MSDLRIGDVEIETGLPWLDNLRKKRLTPRRGPLWPETQAEWTAHLARHPNLKSSDLAFRTLQRHALVLEHRNAGEKITYNDAVGKWLAKVLRHLGLKVRGVPFGALTSGTTPAYNGGQRR